MTFLEAWERLHKIKENTDHAAVDAIFTGINVAPDFWDNFILVCNNKDNLSVLLNVPPEKIATWPTQIQKYLEKSKSHTNPEAKEKTQMISTAENI